MANLDHRHPIVFFPIRIETRYSKLSTGELVLRLRFYPDQVTLNNFDYRLTRKEVEDGRDYWKAIEHDIDSRNRAWIKLANQYGLPRASYISKAVVNYDPDSDPDPAVPSLKADGEIPVRAENDNLAATCQLLPSRFEVYGKFKDPTLDDMVETGNEIPESLQLNPLQNIEKELAKWVVHFQTALEKGMAIEKKLTKEEYDSGFEYIIAYGIRDIPPDKTKKNIEDLFNAHRYSNGLRLVKQGTPTNLVKETSKDRQSLVSPDHPTQSSSIAYRSVEFGALDEEHEGQIVLHAPDGGVLERALGLDNVANGLPNANNYDQLTGFCLSTALWPSVLGYFMDKFANIQNLDIESLHNHFVRYVSAQGFVPPICVGKTPYGILPVTILSEWEDKVLLAGTDHIRTFFEQLKTRWFLKDSNNPLSFIDQVPTIMNKTNSRTDNLLNILSMEAVSHSYNVRGFRSLNYVADFIFEILKKTPTDSQIVTSEDFSKDLMVKNKLFSKVLLKLTFPRIPAGVLSGLYENCQGSGISRLELPMVSKSEEADDVPPEYIQRMYDDIKGTHRRFLKKTTDQIGISGVEPSDSDPLLLRLLRYSASLIGENHQGEIEKFLESLEVLKKTNPDRLETLMLQTLDVVSYRLDAWISSFANQRLDHLRRTEGKGLYAGAFGWIENLMPRAETPISEGGYIQAPSYAHAAASAVLRNGYLIHANEREKRDLLKINLNSERTKNALETINGITNTPLPELLGYKLERRLHDAKIDYLIDEFRKHFPLNKDDNEKLGDVLEQGQERIEPRNLTDGLAVFKNWKRLVDTILSFDAAKIRDFMAKDDQVPGWKPFFFEIKQKYADQDEKILRLINDLKPQLNYLLDQMDGLSDLCIAESVFQAVGGNFSRSGAVLDGMSGDGQIPVPEISLTPRTGPKQTQRVGLAIEVELLENLILHGVDDTVPWTNPRKLAEPNINELIKTYVGAISFWIDLKDVSGNVTTTKELGLTDLGLEAIDLLFIENSELNARLHYFAKSNGLENYEIRYEQKDSVPEQIEKRSLVDMQFLIKALRQMVTQGRPLDFTDLNPTNQTNRKGLLLHSIKEVFQRYYDLILLLIHTLEELESASNNHTEPGIEKKRQALIKAGFFASEFAVPVSPEGNILELEKDLNDKIKVAIEQLKSRLPHPNDEQEKLLGWKSKFETEGQEAFMEILVDELSGEHQDDKKYLKTLDLLVEQVRKILNINSFLILPPLTISKDTTLKTSPELNGKVLKWIEKTSYVRPRIKFLDEIITYNQIFESSNFSFYCDEAKFMMDAETLAKEIEELNPVSLILVNSIKPDESDDGNFPKNLAAIVADDWADKIVSKEQDTHIAFHYNGPNTEAPQCLLLAVSPNDQHIWNNLSIRKVILDTLELTKLRAVDHSLAKELRNFLPTVVLNSHGEDNFINLFQGNFFE